MTIRKITYDEVTCDRCRLVFKVPVENLQYEFVSVTVVVHQNLSAMPLDEAMAADAMPGRFDYHLCATCWSDMRLFLQGGDMIIAKVKATGWKAVEGK